MTTVNSPERIESREVPPFARSGVIAVALLLAAAYLISLGRPGFWGDELYFIAAGRRPSISYADQGPLVPAVAWLMDVLAPDSPFALRLPAALASVAAVAIPALIAREFGGGRRAQVLAAIGYATSVFVVASKPLCTLAFDLPLTATAVWLLIRWVRVRADWLLIMAGLAAALAIQVKWLVPGCWAALGVAVLLAGPRELLLRPALWLGSAIFAAAWAPSLIWQANHGWPQLRMARAIGTETGDFGEGPLFYVPQVILLAGLVGGALFVYGVWHILRSPALRPYRFLVVALALLTVFFIATSGRPYYGAGIVPAFIAAGAVGLGNRDYERLPKIAGAALITVSAVLVLIPLSVLPLPESGIHEPAVTTKQAIQRGFLYGQTGWAKLAAATATAYGELPPDERDTAVIVAESYWQASAVDHYRRALPAVYSPNRGYGYFGSPPDSATTVVYIGGDPAKLRTEFADVRLLVELNDRLGFPGVTSGVTIWKCGRPTRPWSQAWPDMLELDQHYL
ncbi:glycosyltransferase family 39 protein [Nocardia arthritidis]|uniref:Glycosyl transferase family 39 n=1 Tax=Nocardia arthritidis TaxID=228602 RepID=A0A6G9Y4N3_9NOCA|nr:glycosyltransferase family 39 protein [Nocardia arthritidis]QIS08188.1 glycosyl transferase family 39 [Nocardia arthritidis]